MKSYFVLAGNHKQYLSITKKVSKYYIGQTVILNELEGQDAIDFSDSCRGRKFKVDHIAYDKQDKTFRYQLDPVGKGKNDRPTLILVKEENVEAWKRNIYL